MGWEGGEGRVRIGRGEWRYKIKGVLELVKIIGLPSSQNNFIYFIAVNCAERFGSVAFFITFYTGWLPHLLEFFPVTLTQRDWESPPLLNGRPVRSRLPFSTQVLL